MAKIQILVTKYIRKVERTKIKLSPQEKFNRIVKRAGKRNEKIRKYHFNTIEYAKEIIVFNGDGQEIIREENSHSGYRIARAFCLNLFMHSDQAGGFNFTYGSNLELQSEAEINAMHKLALDQTDKIIHCLDCMFRFESISERQLHRCTKEWMILNFSLHKRK